MKAAEISSYLRSLDGGWMDQTRTVDTFKAGNPETEVKGIAVAWQSHISALQQAAALGCNLFITHEPTFYNHFDLDSDDYAAMPGFAAKQRLIEQLGMVVLRCHDLWDQLPGDGITDTWASVLGFQNPLQRDGYYQVYESPKVSALQVARQVAAAVQPFGQEAVQLIGPADRVVRRVGIGTGAICSFRHMAGALQVDLAVCTDDGISTWRDGAYAVDHHIPIVVVNHAVSEEAGMRSLARCLQQAFAHIAVHHIPQGCSFRLVGP